MRGEYCIDSHLEEAPLAACNPFTGEQIRGSCYRTLLNAYLEVFWRETQLQWAAALLRLRFGDRIASGQDHAAPGEAGPGRGHGAEGTPPPAT